MSMDVTVSCTEYNSTRIIYKVVHTAELVKCNTVYYYMASSVSGQDEPNRAL